MSDEILRIWLRNEASFRALDALAASRGWTLIADEIRAHSSPTQRVYRATSGADVGFHEDHPLGVRHVWISGPGAQALKQELETSIAHWTRAELCSGLSADNMLERISRVRVLSCMERQGLSKELHAALSGLMEHSNKIVRRAALHLCWANAWPDMLDAIRLQGEKDEELGEEWEHLAEMLEEAPNRQRAGNPPKD